MAITKLDCLTLLNDLSSKGVNTKDVQAILLKDSNKLIDTLKFINDNRQLDLTKFYEKIRRSYNQKKSILYINIVKDIDVNNISSVVTTLNSYALQVTLFGTQVENKAMFYKFARLDEVYACLYKYAKTFDMTSCIDVLKHISLDIKALETCYRDTSIIANRNVEILK